MCMYTCVCSHAKEQNGYQKTTCQSLCSHSTLWILGIELICNFFRMYLQVYKTISK